MSEREDGLLSQIVIDTLRHKGLRIASIGSIRNLPVTTVILEPQSAEPTVQQAAPNVIAIHAIITDTCRENRTNAGALAEAFRRIESEYFTLCEIHKIGAGINLHVKLEVEMLSARKD